jgi:CRP/FNR family transcriptional regulator, cyclic AMP receptor protein
MHIPNVADRYSRTQNSRTGEFFSSLSVQALNDFKSLEMLHSYPASEVLFQEKQLPNSILVLIEGDVKLSINSSEGKRLILRIAKPGEVLGLTSALSGNRYEMTAETLHTCKIATVWRQDFLGFLLRHPAAYQSLAREMSLDFTRACAQLRTVGLSSSAPAKLARLLIEWCAGGQKTSRGTRLKVSLTHEEIGECIGASRETVTRTFSDFKKSQLVDLQGSTLMISNMLALESYAEL